MSQAIFAAACTELGLHLEGTQWQAITDYQARLYEANKVMNLTRVPFDDCWVRHYLDCVLFHKHIPQGAHVLDLGTGPGLPAFPLACVRPDLKVTALDSSAKMTTFLRSIPLVNLEVVTDRAETWSRPEAFDVVVGRAVAPLPVQIEISAAFCKVGGSVQPLRTPADETMVRGSWSKGLGLILESVESAPLPGTDIVRLLPIFRKFFPTQRRYPRTWAEIKRRPLGPDAP